MNRNCISCLCHFCDRTECRYKAHNANVCNIRCIIVKTSVEVNYKPVLCCDRFHHTTIHKRYKIKLRRNSLEDVLKKMSAADFLRMLGGGKNDKH